MIERRIAAISATRWLAGGVVLVLLLALAAPAARAQSLDQLRAEGVVGERYDGFAVVRSPSAPPGVQQYVADVNAKRRSLYEQRAAQENVPVGQVGRVYATQLFERLPPGSWFLDEAGKWVQK